ncbi:MAG: nucleoside triphosphate pyrophosphohydrolase [Bacteroidales bacterium]|nr:nucleoside triphosphate pyrophosphohydrolase [Bacteroidales bacterium]
MMHTKEEKLAAVGRLLDIMEQLRLKCPWNRAQTIQSLRPMTLEEVYELSDAVLKGDDEELKKELGDVLLHIVFYSRISEENGRFDIADVADKVSDKMVYRHPHVFASTEVADADEVSRNWEMLKTKEKGGNKRVLSGVPDSLPSMLKAFFMQDKARGVGFDWSDKNDVWTKVREEIGEYQKELDAMDAEDGFVEPSQFAPAPTSSEGFKAAYDRAEGELGDLLFSIVNAARLYGLNPDTALNRTCEKFRRRFTYLEEQTLRRGRNLSDLTLAEMDAIWDEAKAKGL